MGLHDQKNSLGTYLEIVYARRVLSNTTRNVIFLLVSFIALVFVSVSSFVLLLKNIY